MPFSIDFGEIRPYEGDRRTGFEGAFRRIEGAGGDGGVEGYSPGQAVVRSATKQSTFWRPRISTGVRSMLR
jgi:hypothetical protein